ncbi:ABC transporter ATP-binding protein [Streptomyces polygonati]|uniref:ABC transporter ATP-binding protein n=1 Tax=Streptomyces polygonati TaxID=1617087 RepID=A0ABV8HV15_9ACTN
MRRPLRAAIALQAVAALCGVVPLVAIAVLATRLTDGSAPTGGRTWPLVSLACGSGLAALALGYAANVVSHLADNTLQLSLRRDLARHIGRLPLAKVTDMTSGAIKSAVQDDVQALHMLVAHTLLDVTSLLTAPTFALIYLFTVDWRLALPSLAPLALGVFLFGRAMAGAKEQMAEYGAAQARITTAAVEFATGIAVVKTFGRGRNAYERFVAATEGFSQFFTRWVRRTLLPSTAALLVVTPVAVLLASVCVGAALVTSGAMPAADLVAFVLIGPLISAPMGVVGSRMQQLRAGQAAARRITTLLDTPALPEAEHPAVPQGSRVALHNVSFSYDGRVDALTGIDLDLRPGTVTALVGPSGSGKSTLAALLARFHDVTAGSITLGGADIRDIPLTELYRHIGFVLQDVRLLRASVADNIRLGRPDATDDDVRQMAQAAQIHDRILALPNGYDTVLNGGTHLSGGESQRISIARALLGNPQVIVLDEATAFADPGSEALIQEALSTLAAGRTLLVVAHRLATVASADSIVVLDAGRIVEQGRHEELLRRNGRYAQMWRAQEGRPPDRSGAEAATKAHGSARDGVADRSATPAADAADPVAETSPRAPAPAPTAEEPGHAGADEPESAVSDRKAARP